MAVLWRILTFSHHFRCLALTPTDFFFHFFCSSEFCAASEEVRENWFVSIPNILILDNIIFIFPGTSPNPQTNHNKRETIKFFLFSFNFFCPVIYYYLLCHTQPFAFLLAFGVYIAFLQTTAFTYFCIITIQNFHCFLGVKFEEKIFYYVKKQVEEELIR